MSLIAVRRSTRRLRHHLAGLLLVCALGTAIAAHHSGVAMPDMHHDGVSAAIEMCLGAFTALGAAVAAVAIAMLALCRWPSVSKLPDGASLTLGGACAPEARAGPPPLAQLCVWRR